MGSKRIRVIFTSPDFLQADTGWATVKDSDIYMSKRVFTRHVKLAGERDVHIHIKGRQVYVIDHGHSVQFQFCL